MDPLQIAQQACVDATIRLAHAAIPMETLAEYVPERKVALLFTKRARMQPIGNVWRLGSLLLSTDARLWSTGKATRAADRGRPGYQSLSREARKDIAAAALLGGYPAGTTVNFDSQLLELNTVSLRLLDSSAPIGFADGAVRVRWRAGASLEHAPTLDTYMKERIDLQAGMSGSQ